MNAASPARADRARTLALFEGGRRLLESMARDAALADVLEDICRLVESVAGGCRCTVLLVDTSGARMEHGAAPSLPDSYNRCLAGRPAVAEFGPCGMAAAQRQQVIVHDVAADVRWTSREWSALALAHGLRACWSTPILSAAGDALGTFAMYWPAPRRPDHVDQDAIQQMTHIAALAIARGRAAAALGRAGHRRNGGDAPARANGGTARRGARAPGSALTSGLRDRYASLTPREREVMTWVVAGLTNKRIGAELGTAEITIKVHRGRVMRKMEADSLAELVRMAARLAVPLPHPR